MRLRTIIIGLVIAAVGVAAAVTLMGRNEARPATRVRPVPSGDHEIAWFNTSTAGGTWERFVSGIHHARRKLPNLEVDDSQAFLERTTSIPEVVVSWKDRPGKLRIRWYKQTTETGTKQWIDALAQRNPPPLAIIGGGSSDRARDLARDLAAQTQWQGARPLLLITTATANEVTLESDLMPRRLTQIYPERTFRFCFTNEQMARAVIDFIWRMPELRPPGGTADNKIESPPTIFPVYWKDDAYSEDLNSRFWIAVSEITKFRCELRPAIQIDYSVGSFDRANASEAAGARTILEELEVEKDQRSLLILPTSTPPARRFLRALAGESPTVGRHLVAVNGDAISFNDVYRDGGLLWNIRDLPVPLVFFAHQNPVGWDEQLVPPAGTDEVLLFARLFEVLLQTALPADGEPAGNANIMAERMRIQRLIPFDEEGNRKDGEEYIVYLRPDISEAGRINPKAPLQVWRRSRGKNWREVETAMPLLAPYQHRSTSNTR